MNKLLLRLGRFLKPSTKDTGLELLEMFWSDYSQYVKPYIASFLSDVTGTDSLLYTLTAKSNRFRSATSIAVAQLLDNSLETVLPIAGASELIHAAIIIQDDVADGDIDRRGCLAAWKEFGLCESLYSAMMGYTICLDMLAGIENENRAWALLEFNNAYRMVCQGQIEQSRLKLADTISQETFDRVHACKGSIGIWALSASARLCGTEAISQQMRQFATLLSKAGALKNDVESFMGTSFNEPIDTDIRSGIVTQPLYMFFQGAADQDKTIFSEAFGKEQDELAERASTIVKESGVVTLCVQMINEIVDKAILAIEGLPSTQNKDLLINWANYHRLN